MQNQVLYDINVIKANIAHLGYLLVWTGYLPTNHKASFELYIQKLSKICKQADEKGQLFAQAELIIAWDNLAHLQSFNDLDTWLLKYKVHNTYEIELINNYPDDYGRTNKKLAKLRKVFKNKRLYYNI